MNNQKAWSIVSHISLLFAPILLPGIVYLASRNKRESDLKLQALEAMAFHIFIAILLFISTLLIVIVLGAIMWMVIPIWATILAIKAAVLANKGEIYAYPFTSQFVRPKKRRK